MLNKIMSISAYGFIITISSTLFMYTGYKIDTTFDTSPSFMLGLFFLAIFITIGKLYKEAMKKCDDV